MSRKGDKGFVVGAALGAALGVIGGILFAPKKGEETRQEWKEKFDEYSDKASDMVKDLQEKSKGVAGDAKELGSSLKKAADEKIQSIHPKAAKEISEESNDKSKKTAKKKYFKGV